MERGENWGGVCTRVSILNTLPADEEGPQKLPFDKKAYLFRCGQLHLSGHHALVPFRSFPSTHATFLLFSWTSQGEEPRQ